MSAVKFHASVGVKTTPVVKLVDSSGSSGTAPSAMATGLSTG